jgi:UDP-N-acetylmuramoyl-L-alanyl-D-glutamate--2,6-diaminopimelate ligase
MTMPSESMTIAALLAGLTGEADHLSQAQTPVRGVTDDSRRVEPGFLFVAVSGVNADGRRFSSNALERGACGVVCEGEPASEDPRIITVPDARIALARIAQRWYGLESQRLPRLIGITGTNGKSTTAYMLRAILRAADQRCGLLGTIEYDLCGEVIPAHLTTPGALELCRLLRVGIDHGAETVVMEVSSHALAQHRTHGLSFAAAGFTNLTQDHLDYHETLDEYAATKARLFDGLAADAAAVINVDDETGLRMVANTPARVIRCGLQGEADIVAKIERSTVAGTEYSLRGLADPLRISSKMVGGHNVSNAVLAAGLAHAVGIAPEQIAAGLASLPGVPGRLDRVAEITGTQVFVDYAHTPDALEHVLAVLRPLTRGRLVCVFGCGGDRDRTKRPLMARAVGDLADAIVLTNDNPRTEDPQQIFSDTLTGFTAKERAVVCIEPDRGRAITAALCGAGAQDVVLIAGKGHEQVQVIGDQRLHFADADVARAAARLHGLTMAGSIEMEPSTP